ncbi:hypothetical protein P153DRAFT_388351 [Dothidotthia symphoricarpi CBS 119687]|uniref:Uncharacterized protein n=1 Tax=Dothidotthia symphoricarpi CBS 119687 TaxID=1392245 RepID=A0A6A6A5F3_9PLEO|nr:uncharacterized protein P153DRAFT_388351 [Dothidotthia symphoricarpi CBS 119687]KAF2127030.1 hypothetical protein P153DRAFT_388351 [Dothidotthia symphoricarpi CBS 119687]
MATSENEIRQAPHEPDTKHSSWNNSPEVLKKEPGVGVNEIDDDDGIYWKPGWRDQFPWIGLAGFITVIVATAMAVTILGVSHKKRVRDWPTTKFPIQPNVLLNIANQMQNLGLLTMIGQGLAIAWWRKAMDGSSLEKLHRNHAYSYSVYAIVTSGKHFNLVALAALMTKFAVIDSTLFQTATKTHITQQTDYTNATVTAWMEPIWTAKSGGIPGDFGRVTSVDANWATVIEAYNQKIANGKLHDLLEDNASFEGCTYRQECTGSVRGLGFAYKCNTTFEDVDYGLERLSNNMTAGNVSYPLWEIEFATKYATNDELYATSNLYMTYVDSHAGTQTGSCPGKKTTRQCEIRPAIVEYPVTVMTPSKEELDGKNIVTHVKFFDSVTGALPFDTPMDTDQIDNLKVVEFVDLDEREGDVSTVGALTYVLTNLYSAYAYLTYTTDWDVEVQGSSAQTTFYADTDEKKTDRCWYDIDKPGRDDPAVEILRKINTLSFVAGLYLKGATKLKKTERAAAGMTSQQIKTTVTGIVEEYLTAKRYVAAALVATLLTVLCVLPVYWRFWELGRKVTLGPLEIANAFNAPIIAPDKRQRHHGDFEEIIQEVGQRRVQYGQIVGAPPGHMGIAEPHKVAKPVSMRPHDHIPAVQGSFALGFGAAIGAVTAVAVGGNVKL